jgi:hypothetical protein
MNEQERAVLLRDQYTAGASRDAPATNTERIGHTDVLGPVWSVFLRQHVAESDS